MKITLQAAAKINLFLDILGKRPDGYHDLELVMQSVNLYDTVTLETERLLQNPIRLICSDPTLPQDESNIAYKAAMAFFQETDLRCSGLTITLEKQIPHAAGLGGGSADAAAVILGLNVLLRTRLTQERLCKIALKVGADVPFCLFGGTLLARGVGEKLASLPPLPDCTILIVKPSVGISTQEAYARYDQSGKQAAQEAVTPLLEALQEGNLPKIGAGLYNAFEAVTDLRVIGRIRKIMMNSGALGSLLSGSGSAVFGIFNEEESAAKIAERLEQQGLQTFLCRPISQTITVHQA